MTLRIKFQSHAGSIEAPGGRFRAVSLFEFQSHAGSIEALTYITDGILLRCRFNPTLVRLRRRKRTATIANRTEVSIPRWFD